MPAIFYSIKTPQSVKGISETFRKNLKKKIKPELKLRLKNAEKREKTSDVVLFFLPIVSRTGTDIDAAVSNIKDPKDTSVILVVLHHTFDPEAVVSDSSKFVQRENTCTVDCLFHEDNGLLKCKINDKALQTAKTFLESVRKRKKARKGSSTNHDQRQG